MGRSAGEIKYSYIPDAGDIVWINFTNTYSHEQKGRRPALVITNRKFNLITNFVLICPLSSKIKGYVFHVSVKVDELEGVVMIDQMKSVSWKQRNIKFYQKLDNEIFEDIRNKIIAMISE